MATASKVQRNYRLPKELVERVQTFSESHGISETEGATRLLALGLESDDKSKQEQSDVIAEVQALKEQRDILREYLATTKEHVSTLAVQLAEKDEQIRRLHDIAEHAQALEAAHVGRYIEAGDHPKGVWGWLAKKIGNA